MNVLSLFDGISCGQQALDRCGIKVDTYYASEIEKSAIKVTQVNYPNTIQLGDVTKINGKELPKIDLLLFGSPCQGFSFAGKGLNFKDPRSKLFFEAIRILNELRENNHDVKFLCENVRMKEEHERVFNNYLGLSISDFACPCCGGKDCLEIID
jgi:DNA-cytosine methyltransferase